MVLVCAVSFLFLSACKKEDPKEVAESDNRKYGENYRSTLRIDMDKLDEEYMKLDPVVRKNYQTKQNVLLLLTRKNGNILYAKQKFTKNLAARTEEEGGSFIEENNPILEEFDNADLKDEEDKPINFFEIDSNKQKQFLKAWTINNGKNLEEKIKLEPTIKDIIIKENQAFEESLQEVKGIAMNSKVAEENRDINFDLLTKKMQEKMTKGNNTNSGGRVNNSAARTTDPTDISFCASNGDVLYWGIQPYYGKGRFLIRLKESAFWLLYFGSPGHCSIISKDYRDFIQPNYIQYYGDEEKTNRDYAFTIGAYTKHEELGTLDGVQYEPFSVWSKAFYVCAPATSSYRWRWCCWFEIMRWELPQNQKDGALANAKGHLGKPYGASVSTNGMVPDKYTTWQYYCSKLIFQIYWQVNKNCNLSTWYEDYPSPNSIFRDDECIVLSPEINWGYYPRPSKPRSSSWKEIERCFLKGTLISMADGTKKPIEQIQIGDKVLSSNGANTVKKIFHNDYTGLIYSINGSDFFVTASHPFKTSEGWKSFNPAEAKKLVPEINTTLLIQGDVLLKENNKQEVLKNFTHKHTQTDVYNFDVDGNHEYIANSYIVHNR